MNQVKSMVRTSGFHTYLERRRWKISGQVLNGAICDEHVLNKLETDSHFEMFNNISGHYFNL